MVKVLTLLLALFLTGSFAVADSNAQMPTFKAGMQMPKNFRMAPKNKAENLQEGEHRDYCPKCGMTLHMFYRTNHAATVNGKVKQYCSLYCLIDDINSGAKVSHIKVVDNTTLKFISAKGAWYVVGSKKPATMSQTSHYAFGTKEAAEQFAKKFGGKVMDFESTLAKAKADYKNDTSKKKMRQAKAAKIGEKIYKSKCQVIDKKFTTAAEAKAYIVKNNSCKGLKGKPLQMVALYLISK
ncbi:MAG TPA: hypothetical protein ENK74_05210 [Nitratifractor sp.]|nr:hypothetical protein [Nitratifractor sp.]